MDSLTMLMFYYGYMYFFDDEDEQSSTDDTPDLSSEDRRRSGGITSYRARGRAEGSFKYDADEVNDLLDIIEELLPVRGDSWKRVGERHRVKYPNRSIKAIRAKWSKLYRYKAKTGDPPVPPAVERARAIFKKITRKRKKEAEERKKEAEERKKEAKERKKEEKEQSKREIEERARVIHKLITEKKKRLAEERKKEAKEQRKRSRRAQESS